MFTNLLSHTDDLHVEKTSEFIHLITEWYLATPLFYGLLAFTLYTLYSLKLIKFPGLINLGLAALLVMGVAAYQTVPFLSISTLAVGIGLALMLTMATLTK